MKRIERPKGGGCGSSVFESKLFEVNVWVYNGGQDIFTELKFKDSNFKVVFDGNQKASFKSDSDCLRHLTQKEILSLIYSFGEVQFDKGLEEGKIQVKRALQDLIFN